MSAALAPADTIAFPSTVRSTRRAVIRPLVLLAIAVVIEQYNGGITSGFITGGLPLFTSLQAQLQLPGVFVNPVDLIMIFVLGSWFLGKARDEAFPGSTTSKLMLALVGLVVAEEIYGLIQGGSSTWSLWEIRPFLYLAGAYLIGAALVRDQATRSALLWVFAIGVTIRGVQGVINASSTQNMVPRPESILPHEEAFFFGVFLLLTVILWMFGKRGRLRTWCTVMAPVVLYADLANQRRSSWLILGLGGAVVFVLALARMRERRARLMALGATVLVIGAIYTSMYWDSTDTLGQPARAIRSYVSPDPRDASSNLYRTLENENLQLNIMDAFPFGKGFGVPINYRIPIVDLTSLDPILPYVPHNNILWLWMRLGVVGFIVFWALLASVVITACRIVRFGGQEAAVYAAFVAASIVAYVIEGNYDYGLYWFRIAIFMGIAMGAIEGLKAGRSAWAASPETNASSRPAEMLLDPA